MLTVLDLFSGIGGISLGLEATGGFRTVAFCEIEAFPRLVLAKHWPGVPIFEDVRTLSAESLGGLQPDLICGGFPCQDVSVAGKGAGLHGHRSGLWFEFARLVEELGPRWVLAENVGALRTRGVDRVCSDLEGEGYAVWPLLVGAWAAGAPHRRERVWIVAHRDSEGRGRERGGGLLDGERATPGHDADGRGERPVGESTISGLEGHRADAGEPQDRGKQVGHQPWDSGTPRWPARPGEPQHEWEEPRLAYASSARDSAERGSTSVGIRELQQVSTVGTNDCARGKATGRPELPLGGAVDGLSHRLARRANRESLKALGNSVVPQVVYAIGRAILEAEANP